eukprot:710710_1
MTCFVTGCLHAISSCECTKITQKSNPTGMVRYVDEKSLVYIPLFIMVVLYFAIWLVLMFHVIWGKRRAVELQGGKEIESFYGELRSIYDFDRKGIRMNDYY